MDSIDKQIAISLDNVTLGFGSRILVDKATVSWHIGQLTAFIGRNGTGKSTLLRSIAGLNNRYEGKISIMGHDVLSAAARAKLLSFVATSRIRIPSMTARQLVALGRYPHAGRMARLTAADTIAVDNAIERTGISALADRTINSLSDGEAQRVMIARAIAQDTPLMLLDEPTSFLDLPSRIELCRLLSQLAHEGRCILFTTHELDLACQFADRIALLDACHLHSGTPAAIAPLIARAFHLTPND